MKIAGISSEKFGDPNEGSLKNNHLYNDKELWNDADLNWYDYGLWVFLFQSYQLGRSAVWSPPRESFGLTNGKNVNDNVTTDRVIAVNTYDELGQLKKKTLAPACNNNEGLEQLNYEYNIRGWLKRMNKDYPSVWKVPAIGPPLTDSYPHYTLWIFVTVRHCARTIVPFLKLLKWPILLHRVYRLHLREVCYQAIQ